MPNSVLFRPQELFTEEQKPGYKLLFILDHGALSKAILVDQNDTRFLSKALAKDRKSDTEPTRSRQIVLYDLGTNAITDQGKNRISEEELKALPGFYSYTAQAKLFDRQITFSPEELSHLKEKTDRVTKARMKSFLYDYILEWKKNAQEAFPFSPLGEYVLT